MSTRVFRVGLTGGIASGKSTAAKFFAGKKKIYLPSYAIMITRSGEASA